MPFDSLPIETTNKTKEVLEDALALIEKGWCKGVAAKNYNGGEALPLSPLAVSFCSVGALLRASEGNRIILNPCKEVLHRVIGQVSITTWNDMSGRTKEEVIAVFKKAIELAHLEGG